MTYFLSIFFVGNDYTFDDSPEENCEFNVSNSEKNFYVYNVSFNFVVNHHVIADGPGKY